MMAGNKTGESGDSLEAYLGTIEDPARRADAAALAAMMARATGEAPVVWGKIVGFGRYHYRYESGREGDSMLTGFAVRAKELVLYLGLGSGELDALLARLGRHKTGKGCLYLKSLGDADMGTLEELVARAHEAAKARHGG